jgi:amino acid transporter
MSQKRLYKALIFFVILGVIISRIMFIPSWENIRTGFMVSTFLLATTVGVICMLRLWKWKRQYKGLSKPAGWFNPAVFSIILVVGLPLACFFSFASAGHGFLGPHLIKEVTLGKENVYLYHNVCLAPSACECEVHFGLVYKKHAYLPTLHLLTKTDFHASDARLEQGELTILASNRCPRDRDKTKKVKL